MAEIELCEWSDPRKFKARDKNEIISCEYRQADATNLDAEFATCTHPNKPDCDSCPNGYQ